MTKKLKPPVAPVKSVTGDYFGTKVTDNYRYMENFKDQAVQQWVKAQADCGGTQCYPQSPFPNPQNQYFCQEMNRS